MKLRWWRRPGTEWSNKQLFGWSLSGMVVMTTVAYVIQELKHGHVHLVGIASMEIVTPTFLAVWQWFLRETERERRGTRDTQTRSSSR